MAGSADQSRLTLWAIRNARLSMEDVWLRYFSIGGEAALLEVEAYLNRAMDLPQIDRDTLAHAVNEMIAEKQPDLAPYSNDPPPPGGHGDR